MMRQELDLSQCRQLLHLESEVNETAVERHFRFFVLAYHPDRFPDSFREMAHELLCTITRAKELLIKDLKQRRLCVDVERKLPPKDAGGICASPNCKTRIITGNEWIVRRHNHTYHAECDSDTNGWRW